MGKPRAARTQPVVLSSDSEAQHSPSPPPARPTRGTLPGTANGARRDGQPDRVQARRAASPKPRKAAKSPVKPKAALQPITSFFSNVPRSQVFQRGPSPEKTDTPPAPVDDILDSSDEHRPLPVKPAAALPVRKRRNDPATADVDNAVKARQKFLRTATGARSTPPPPQPARPEPEDRRPWTDKYGPVSLEELAVHKKKVADVRSWLTDVISGRSRKRLLLLKGSAGSGKTTTMALLSKELGIAMHEWKNPSGSMSTSENFVSATAQFEDFVGRTGTFGSLTFEGQSQKSQHDTPSSTSSRQKQLVLVEEFPNTFTRTSSAVQSFRSSVLNYLAANTQSATAFFSSQADAKPSVTPIVMIISETLLSTNTAAADSFTAHRLLGPEILTHPGVSVLEFNPIAPTYMTKALETVIVKEARKSGRRNTLGPQVIQRLAELGDIRSAVSSLEFLCLRGDDSEGWGAKVNFTKKKGPKDTPMTKMEHESLELVTQRESTLGIFHAVGRVVYNKRLPESTGPRIAQPPNWFPERRRPKASEVNLDTLIDETGTDTQTFIAALHENYVLSCGGADSEETMDSIEGCIEALSDADLLSPVRFGAGSGRRNLQGTGADNLRQDEMCFQTSVRGLLYNLPMPVKRLTPPAGVMGLKPKGQPTGSGAPKGNAYVMYYPASLRLWKQQEEIGGLLELWITRAQRGELLTPSSSLPRITNTTSGGVDTWRKNASFTPTPSSTSAKSTDDNHAPSILLGSGGSARFEMLLERLPYLTTILRKSHTPSPSTAATIREIQKITAFGRGSINSNTEDDDDARDVVEEGGLDEQEQWTTDQPAAETPRRRKGVKFQMKESELESAIPGIVESGTGLVLSDDDIED
ncbi:Rad17-domain-containing protein [Plenodomus tracheiphilus IPT5]|uniref:Rad17-domain-containing protein n=1 Tax=Plenodomus tracheiphilus IPT5 TaxID=1408161 RepID=A0A6A7BMV1_9PLEO|nr:Rad17-domain-containing protein [Plenodomus tracheiphilus IPT5]